MLAIQIRRRTPQAIRYEAHWGNFGPRVHAAAITCKTTHRGEPSAPRGVLSISRLHGPFQRQLARDVGGVLLLHEGDKTSQASLVVPQFEAQTPSHPQVIVDGFSERLHRSSPGQGSAN